MKISFSDFYYGMRPFFTPEEIINHCKESGRFKSDIEKQESLENAGILLLFESQGRRSWLVRSNKRLYKLIDDQKEEKPKINWSVDLDTAQSGDVRVTSTGGVGRWKVNFDFRQDKEYLVDQRLFQNIGVEKAISDFIGMDDKYGPKKKSE